jgi:hypothetical protein
MRTTFAATLGAVSAVAVLGAQVIKVDPALTPYQRTSGVSGNISSIGWGLRGAGHGTVFARHALPQGQSIRANSRR